MSGKLTSAGGRGLSAEIRLDGLEETFGVLRAVEPEAQKELGKEFRAIAAPVAAGASAAAPPGHTLKYRTQITWRGRKAGMRIRAADRDTAIFEFAGTVGQSRSGGEITPQGAAMVAWLNTFGSPGRFLWASWDQRKADIEAQIRAAMARVEKRLQSRLDGLGVSY